MKVNYDRMMEQVISEWESSREKKPDLLLHSCCGPCSTAVIERLLDHFDVTVFYYNPNIDERAEYEKRRDAQKAFLEKCYGMRFSEEASRGSLPGCGSLSYEEGPYDPERFHCIAAPFAGEREGGERCRLCFEMRLAQTALRARQKGFSFFTTTLTVSPMKNAQIINEIGMRLQEEVGVLFLPSDFKKKSGYQRSIQLSKEYGLYRQHFCGCGYSKNESCGNGHEKEK